jgi:hypothetical protein
VLAARRAALGAGLAALDGSVDQARVQYREAMARLEAFGLPYAVAMTGLTAVATLGPEDETAIAAAAQARGILEGLGATAMVDRLHDALARRGATVRD